MKILAFIKRAAISVCSETLEVVGKITAEIENGSLPTLGPSSTFWILAKGSPVTADMASRMSNELLLPTIVPFKTIVSGFSS